MDDKVLMDAVRDIKGKPLVQSDVDAVKTAIAIMLRGESSDPLTRRVAMETIQHEAIVCEAYRDSKRIWTWSVGLTDNSGVSPLTYKDKPASVAECLTAFVRVLRTKYLPEVQRAFKGRTLTEEQLAAAVSFHWNTGAIDSAQWVKSWLAGNVADASVEIMNWRSPAEIIPRREAERNLFFDGKWAQSKLASIVPVNKPSYQPSFKAAKKIDISSDLDKALVA